MADNIKASIQKIKDLIALGTEASILEAKQALQELRGENVPPELQAEVDGLDSEIDRADKEISAKEAKQSQDQQAEERQAAEKEEEIKAQENKIREEQIKKDLEDFYKLTEEIDKNNKEINKIFALVQAEGRRLNKEEKKFIKDNHEKRWESVAKGEAAKEKLAKTIKYRTDLSEKLKNDLQKPGANQEEINNQIKSNHEELEAKKKDFKKVEDTLTDIIKKELLEIKNFKNMGEIDFAKETMIDHLKERSEKYGQNPNSEMEIQARKLASEIGITEEEINQALGVSKNGSSKIIKDQAKEIGNNVKIVSDKKKDMQASLTKENQQQKVGKDKKENLDRVSVNKKAVEDLKNDPALKQFAKNVVANTGPVPSTGNITPSNTPNLGTGGIGGLGQG
ncbi:MAG: hypothetical protein HRU35_04120 [Rickettsiaceae bacterium]|nr:hypothetical protein [Rickettsiaceae bacterium]